eukprot:TRINITY_DN1421_c0_g1_i1.p1 TRINITY_DN1421_c0_g1~~TRINITY_DN1421_c0_g1_i1.p1  ORF type:complete len:1546 (-),score=390.98 TRINITY_DN1421_c0_g1_i1:282-4919(-)
MSNWREYTTPDGLTYYHNQATGETSWDKPEELKGDEDRELAGDWVWMPHPEQAYVPARFIQKYMDGSSQVQTEDGQYHVVPKTAVLNRLERTYLKKRSDDLVQMDMIDEGMIIHNLHERFKRDEIYTNIGTILISVNPFKPLPLYTPLMMERYSRKGMSELPPHIYNIAEAAYRAIVEGTVNQSILISGESGAGKTEATKQVLQYLAEVGGSTSGVEQKILLSNPILEAFGNAKTLRNNNSSRFGKWMEILFDQKKQICGAKTQNYLLEKSRVVFQTPGERNYHIFYQICQGASDALRKRVGLSYPEDYIYLNKSGCISINGVDDASDFLEMQEAMHKLGFTNTEVDAIFDLAAAILHLGNLIFRPTEDEQGSVIQNAEALKLAAGLLKLQPADLQKALTSRVMQIKGQPPMNIPLNPQQASDNRDALAKTLYGNMFDWLVSRINQAMSAPAGTAKSLIGVLDIFGFEIFEKNSFEQLCINFANEKLQQHFNQHTFKLEEELYQSEKVPYDHVDFIDNQPVLDLIENKPSGILAMLDEEIVVPKGDDNTFLQKLHTKHTKKHEKYVKPLRPPTAFGILHYAGQVIYDTAGFLEKNKDTLYEDLLNLMTSSGNPFIRSLFPITSSSQRKSTLGNQFKNQLLSLMTTLHSTNPHYVRCVKPNSEKVPGVFDRSMSLLQLRYSGVFEAVRIRKTGYPFRYTHQDFWKRYRLLGNLELKKAKLPAKELCAKLLAYINKNYTKQMHIGATRVLYRAEPHRSIELDRNVALQKVVIFLQAAFRGTIARRLAIQLKKVKPVLIQAMKARDLGKIQAALKLAAPLPFQLFETVKARQLEALIIEEQSVIAKLKELSTKDPDTHYESIMTTLAHAERLQLKEEIVGRVTKAVAIVRERRETEADLKAASEAYDEDKLIAALARAKKIPMTGELVTKAQKILDHVQAEKKIIQKLTSALSSGFCVNCDRSTIVVDALQKGIKEAQTHHMETKDGKRMLEVAEIHLQIRNELKVENWEGLDQVIRRGLQLKVESSELQAAKKELAHKMAVDKVVDEMREAIAKYDHISLSMLVENGRDLGLQDTEHSALLASGEEMLASILEALRRMQSGLDAVSDDILLDAVQYSESFGYETDQVALCRDLYHQITRLRSQADQGLKLLVKELMEATLKEADSIRFKFPDGEKLREILYDIPLENFLKMQLKVAMAMNDRDRAAQVTAEIKEEFFSRYGMSQFEFAHFGNLKTAEHFASAKFFGRDELKMSFLQWTRNPIPTSMCRLDDKLTKIATRLFKNIQGFMGDRQLPYPNMLAQEIITQAHELHDIRDEIYCQLIKQLTYNESPESEMKGWQLMQIFVQSFPPSDGFSNFLEVFLRTRAKETPNAHAKDFLNWLHMTMFVGPRSVDVQEILNRAKGDARGKSVFMNSSSIVAAALATLSMSTTSPTTLSPTTTKRTEPVASVAKTASSSSSTATKTAHSSSSSTAAAPSVQKTLPPPPPPAEPSAPCVRMLYDYTSDDPNHLAVSAGTIIEIIQMDHPDWWYGQVGEQTGYFPSSYCEKI